jgi:hypothetical protein
METNGKKIVKDSKEKIAEIKEVEEKIDSTNKIICEVNSINQSLPDFLFDRGNNVIDIKNFSLFNITPIQDLI